MATLWGNAHCYYQRARDEDQVRTYHTAGFGMPRDQGNLADPTIAVTR